MIAIAIPETVAAFSYHSWLGGAIALECGLADQSLLSITIVVSTSNIASNYKINI